ncbi:MAG: hypothetical protein ACJ792_10875 [Gemmatimonadaceae bacterium]
MLSTLRASSLRQLVLALVGLGVAGLWVELLLLRHAESVSQLIPHVALGIGVLATAAVFFRPTRGALRFFQVVMLVFLIAGALGIYLHYRGNVEFAVERDPSLAGVRLVWKSLRGATPALAPGALAQLGLLGLIFTYRHPVLSDREHAELEQADE